MRMRTRLALALPVLAGVILAVVPQPALAESGCQLTPGICYTVTIPICILEEECWDWVYDLPGQPT
jgi:hypothetical protein